jgi:UPF0271 protein
MLPAMRPFLNIDAGELDDEPTELYALAHAVSVACGGHAGDAASMDRVVRACVASGTRIGAHPSYEDRAGFGRTEQRVAPEGVERLVREQCAKLADVAARHAAKVTHVKAHGALYHAANREDAIARAVVAGAREALGDVIVLGPPEGALRRAAEQARLGFAREGFADRAMRPDGSLVPRGEPGALIGDAEKARAQAASLAAGGSFETICVHGDSPNALAIARAVREVLGDA